MEKQHTRYTIAILNKHIEQCRLVSCFTESDNHALSYAIKKSDNTSFCKIIKKETVSHKQYLREKLMMKLSSPKAIANGMDLVKFLKKFPEILSEKIQANVFTRKGDKTFFEYSMQSNNRNWLQIATAKAEKRRNKIQQIGQCTDRLEFFISRFTQNNRFLSGLIANTIRKVNFCVKDFEEIIISVKDNIEAQFNKIKKLTVKYLINPNICTTNEFSFFNNISKNLQGTLLGISNAYTSDKSIKKFLTLVKNNEVIPEFIIKAISKLENFKGKKISDNKGINDAEKILIAQKGVFKVMSENRCGIITNVPKKILADMYETGKNIKSYLPYTAPLAYLFAQDKLEHTLDYKIAEFIELHHNNPLFFQPRTLHLSGGKCIFYNWAGISKYLHYTGIKKSLKKTYENLVAFMLNITDPENKKFPILQLPVQNENIKQLTDAQSVKNTAKELQNCMETYIESVADGYTYLFRAEKDGEIAGIEITDGHVEQIQGYRNSPVSKVMHEMLDKWIQLNNKEIKATICTQIRKDLLKWGNTLLNPDGTRYQISASAAFRDPFPF